MFIPSLSTFKAVTENYYGSYWAGMQPSDKTGETLSIDGVHFNDNGAALFSKIVASVFDEISFFHIALSGAFLLPQLGGRHD
ncbi:hypothetical protein [Acinetobacter baumannii]|uniref:hypothetical protein n=1 Tax=Acinetobacter baumannii TaxID=470 RepID=UPI00081091D5|nr:hypothetical protein [Acinetobacter baumannii]